jgi:hypothetical protein
MSIILRALLLGLLLSGLGWCSAVGDAQAQTVEEMRRMVEEAKKAKAKGKAPAPPRLPRVPKSQGPPRPRRLPLRKSHQIHRPLRWRSQKIWSRKFRCGSPPMPTAS